MRMTRDVVKKIRDPKDLSCKDGLDKGQKYIGPDKKKILRRGGKNT